MAWKYKYVTDQLGYNGADSGCAKASTKLGYQSNCLINCPFERCKMWGKGEEFFADLNGDRETRIAELKAEGKSPGQISVVLRLPWQYVLAVLKSLDEDSGGDK